MFDYLISDVQELQSIVDELSEDIGFGTTENPEEMAQEKESKRKGEHCEAIREIDLV